MKMILFIHFLFYVNYFGLSLSYATNTFQKFVNIDLFRHRITPDQMTTILNTSIGQRLSRDLNSASTSTNDSVALYKYLNDQFYAKVVIGHPGQIFNMVFDTTWSVSWIMSSKCSVKVLGCWFHNKYNHDKSSQYIADNKSFELNELKGFYAYDNIHFGHINVTNASFVEMESVPRIFLLYKVDGFISLGLKTTEFDPIFYQLLSQNKIQNPIFSIYLNRDPHSTRAGNVLLGYIDDRHIHKTTINNRTVSDKINYYKVDPDSNYWMFAMDRVIVENVNHKKGNNLVVCERGCKGFIDSSANAIIGPVGDINKIHDSIQAKEFFFKRYTVDCNLVNYLPKIYFTIGGQNYTLKGPQYTVQMAYGSSVMCLSVFQPKEENIWMLGGAFLAQYYSIYNVKDRKIGFVKAA